MSSDPIAAPGGPGDGQAPLEAAGAPGTSDDEVALHPGQRLLQGRWGWLDAVIVGPMIAKTLYHYLGVPLGQYLLLNRHPIRAALLRGSIPAMVLSGAGVREGNIALWLALLAPLPYLMITDPCFYWGGRRYGRLLIDYLCRTDPRWVTRVAKGERYFARFAGWAVFLAPVLWLPNDVFYFLAGETRMRFWRFISLDLAGQVLFIAEIVALGYFIGKPAEDFANGLSKYSLWIIGATFALALILGLPNAIRGARSQTKSGGDPPPR